MEHEELLIYNYDGSGLDKLVLSSSDNPEPHYVLMYNRESL